MKKIFYQGRELPCYITMGTMVRFKRETGRDVSTIQDGDIADLVVLLWCAIKAACGAEGIPFDTPFDLFADTLTVEVMQDFIKGLAEQGGDDSQKKSPEKQK